MEPARTDAALHDLRVAARRLRSRLRGAPGGAAREVRRALKGLLRATGPARDAEAALEAFDGAVPARDRPAPLRALRRRLARRAARLRAAAPLPPEAGAADAARRRLRRLLARVTGPGDEARQHAARLAAKRLRYLLEASGTSAEEAARARALQDALGGLRDLRLLEARATAAERRALAAALTRRRRAFYRRFSALRRGS